MDEFIQTADGVRLFVETLGQGEAAIIIPNAIYMRRGFERLAQKHRLILFDLRNRGRSDAGAQPDGIWNDVEDIEAVRAHFGLESVKLIGHSYLGLVVALYAMRYPARASRVIQMSPAQPELGKSYAPPLSYSDEVLRQTWAALQGMEGERATLDPAEFCRKWWSVARRLFVQDPEHVEWISEWGFCELENERSFMKHWIANIVPSLQKLRLGPEDFARVTCPVLTIHGTKDRSAPYGGAVDWARQLPRGKLLTVEGAGHVPWVEAPEVVWEEVEEFLASPQEPFSSPPVETDECR